MEFLVILIIIVLVVRWFILRARIDEMSARIASVEARSGSEVVVSSLVARVYKLECELMELKSGVAPPAPGPAAPVPPPPKRYIEEVYVTPAPVPQPEPEAPAPPPPPPPPPPPEV